MYGSLHASPKSLPIASRQSCGALDLGLWFYILYISSESAHIPARSGVPARVMTGPAVSASRSVFIFSCNRRSFVGEPNGGLGWPLGWVRRGVQGLGLTSKGEGLASPGADGSAMPGARAGFGGRIGLRCGDAARGADPAEANSWGFGGWASCNMTSS